MTTLRNRVQLVGNLGIDPEIVKFESGKKLAKFTVATNESFTDAKGNKTTDTQWHNIVAWGKQADLVEQHLKKGNNVTIEGKLAYRQYEDKNKQKHYITEIVLSSFILSPADRKSA